MKSKEWLKIGVVLLLPILLSLALVVSVNASQKQNSDLDAHVNVFPAATIECEPDVLNLKSKGNYITCIIELSGADVKDIDISTVKLSVVGKTGSVPAELSPTYIDDSDYDGIKDMMVKFNRSQVHSFFTGLTNPQHFNLNITGYVNGFPFWGIDNILVINPPKVKLVTYFQIDTKELSKGKINKLDDIDLVDYTTTFTHITGYFFSDSRLHGSAEFYFQGKVKNYIPFFNIPYYRPISVSVQMDELKSCDAFNTTVHCEGKGFLLIKPGKKITLDNLIFDIQDNKATIVGGKYYSDIVSIVDIPVNVIQIKYK